MPKMKRVECNVWLLLSPDDALVDVGLSEGEAWRRAADRGDRANNATRIGKMLRDGFRALPATVVVGVPDE